MNARLSWTLTAFAYTAAVAFVVLSYLQLCSIYGSYFFGLWMPPSNETFQFSTAVCAFGVAFLGTIGGGFVCLHGGSWLPRIIAGVPAVLGLMVLSWALVETLRYGF